MTEKIIIRMRESDIIARLTARTTSREIYEELQQHGQSSRSIAGRLFFFEAGDDGIDVWKGSEYYDSVTSLDEIRWLIEEEFLYGVH